MFKHNVTWTDFNNKPHNEDIYFHMMVPEFSDLAYNPEFGPGGLYGFMKESIGGEEADNRRIYMIFKLLVVNSYGRRSEDGASFRKKAEWTEEFLNSPAWEQFFLWLTDPENGDKNSSAFWTGITPESMRGQFEEIQAAAEGKDVTKMSRDELEAMVKKALEAKKSVEE